MKITVELVQSWRPCKEYPEARLRELLGEGLEPLEVAALDIPEEDRIWALLRSEVLGDGAQRVSDTIVERAVRRVLGESGVPEWERWAELWLSGEDRSAKAARDARDAAWEVWAARDAARAAEAAEAAEAARDADAAKAAREAARAGNGALAALAAAAASAAAWASRAVFDAREAARDARADERTAQLADIVAELRRAQPSPADSGQEV